MAEIELSAPAIVDAGGGLSDGGIEIVSGAIVRGVPGKSVERHILLRPIRPGHMDAGGSQRLAAHLSDDKVPFSIIAAMVVQRLGGDGLIQRGHLDGPCVHTQPMGAASRGISRSRGAGWWHGSVGRWHRSAGGRHRSSGWRGGAAGAMTEIELPAPGIVYLSGCRSNGGIEIIGSAIVCGCPSESVEWHVFLGAVGPGHVDAGGGKRLAADLGDDEVPLSAVAAMAGQRFGGNGLIGAGCRRLGVEYQ